jgi:cytochrome c peroxidase
MSALARGALLLFLALAPARLFAQEETDPTEVAIGERLFLETRFAEFFARNATDVNLPLPTGDPVVASTDTPGAPLPGPFAGSSINCRACHLVDEQLEVPGGGMRTYTDFARRSPVPAREDGRLTAVRNSPPLVNASLPRSGGLLLHFDGEFATLEELVRDTLTGRNYGWLPGESAPAAAHVARVIREDDGSGDLAQEFGGSYARVLGGTDPALPAELRLRKRFRLDVERASDREILDAVARLIAAYVSQLEFETDERGAFVGSPFDRFLALNDLPRAPRGAEKAARHSERLRRSLEKLHSPRFVAEGPFAFHDQQREFGAEELEGLRIFLAEPPARGSGGPERRRRGGIGNCVACHPAPAFTDFRLHNTGVSQLGYDEVHGDGSFLALDVPDLARRNLDPDAWLPATARHPNAREPFRAIPRHGNAGLVDLGAWNVFANPDFPGSQARLRRALCLEAGPRRRCDRERLLARALATFKTPGLRDLSHSAPYMHDGAFDTLEDVIGFYRRASELARSGELRNGAAPIAEIVLAPEDVAPLAAFLRSLNEDYE